uniref:BTB domain-containing protein n=1 Tax=Caenorhabditis tropicalis TaxID=1561998 RepID=A0A1I7UI58_9PELO
MAEIMHKLPSSKTVLEPDYTSVFKKTDETNAVLVVDGKKFHVNKAVLSYYSDYFKTLFESEFKEKSMKMIEIKDVKLEDFATLLSLVLKDPIMPTVNNAEKLLELADRFLLPAAKHHVEYVLLESSVHCLDKIRIAEKFQLEDLFERGLSKCKETLAKQNILRNPIYQQFSMETKAKVFYRCI